MSNASSASSSTTNQSRKVSMTMADLEAIHEERTTPSAPAPSPQDENVDIFQEICMDIEQEYNVEKALTPPVSRRQRRGSLCQDEDDIIIMNDCFETAPSAFRRHSGYESRARRESRKAHANAKEYLEDHVSSHPHAERRASFVNNMLEFNLSLSIADGSDNNKSRMQLSCPVLSYMNDDEEDSVELRMMKRPSMTYVGDESTTVAGDESSWEGLNDTLEHMQQSREYVIELPPMEQDTKPRQHRRRRKPHSYKMLEQQLEQHSPMEVLKQFNTSFNVPTPTQQQPRPAAAPAQPKTLDADNDLRKAMSMSSPPMAASRPATARGA